MLVAFSKNTNKIDINMITSKEYHQLVKNIYQDIHQFLRHKVHRWNLPQIDYTTTPFCKMRDSVIKVAISSRIPTTANIIYQREQVTPTPSPSDGRNCIHVPKLRVELLKLLSADYFLVFHNFILIWYSHSSLTVAEVTTIFKSWAN